MLGRGSLRCAIGWHAPHDGGVWNHGYCFSTCARCGRDMVRSLFGEWHVPAGFRIVRDADAGAVERLDAAMTALDLGMAGPPPPSRPVAASKSAPVRHAPAADSTAWFGEDPPPPAGGSPFDFDDFDALGAANRAVAAPQTDPDVPPRNRASH